MACRPSQSRDEAHGVAGRGTAGRGTRIGLSRCARAAAVAALTTVPALAQQTTQDFGLRGATTTPAAAALSQPERRAADLTAGATSAPTDSVINYGKPRAKRPPPKAFPPGAQPRQPLPPLVPYRGSRLERDERRQRPLPPVFAPDVDPPRIVPPPTIAAVPLLAVKPRPLVEADPYAPPGIGVGSLRLSPFVESGLGYDTNPNRVTSPQRGSAYWRGDAGVAVQSDWSQHSLSGSLRGGYSDFFSVPAANRPDGAGSLAGRIDVTRDTSIDLGTTFALDTLRQGSPELVSLGTATSTNRPLVYTFGGFAGVTERFNRLEVSLRGLVDRSQYGNAHFSDGSTVYLSDNDYTTVGLRPRLAYELTPGLKPFVEATVDKRIYDNTLDVSDYRRSSRGFTVRGGASFDVSRGILTGEVSGGFTQRDYDDARLKTIRGPLVDAALIWTATPLTTVTLRGTTTVSETTIAGVSGALSQRISGEISHALLRNVTITGSAAYQTSNYKGVDPTISTTGTINERFFTAGVRAEYHLTRSVVVKASYGFERLKSTVTGSDYTANVFLVGLRLQR